MRKMDAERDRLRGKVSEVERLLQNSENKRNFMIFDHEKEKAKWSLEKDQLLCQKQELKDKLERL